MIEFSSVFDSLDVSVLVLNGARRWSMELAEGNNEIADGNNHCTVSSLVTIGIETETVYRYVSDEYCRAECIY